MFARLLFYYLALNTASAQWAQFWRTSDENELAGTRVSEMVLRQLAQTAQVITSTVSRYPATLIDEYRALAKKELHGSMTPEEAVRFKEIREQINALDRQRPRPDIWDIQRGIIQEELAQIRAEIDMLPNAE